MGRAERTPVDAATRDRFCDRVNRKCGCGSTGSLRGTNKPNREAPQPEFVSSALPAKLPRVKRTESRLYVTNEVRWSRSECPVQPKSASRDAGDPAGMRGRPSHELSFIPGFLQITDSRGHARCSFKGPERTFSIRRRASERQRVGLSEGLPFPPGGGDHILPTREGVGVLHIQDVISRGACCL